ncbi:ABC transporter ATP-binding protein [Phreatobacter sp.]|uniref:ABC transporter ATP-binding protein n=1 Tax=Phreatobacter sp. TaxID=1966341 RepID=UPI0022CA4772|nr:ABC transporter ATP-binding protein [Phreatobacter sp.]MCZ8315160.1 ABC transporter ATP-binding protein [Phreatobacter sp.]
MDAPATDSIISVRDLAIGFGDRLIIDGLDLDVQPGEVLGVVGGSGTGKSVLTRCILGLVPKRRGTIEAFGQNLDGLSRAEHKAVERRWGVLFQHGALFSSLTVKQNIQVPLREYLKLSEPLMDEIARLKIAMVGLRPDAGDKFPSELSGGMIKRAALARALALDPEIVFLDEPTSGLDPIGAEEFDTLIRTLRDTLGLTVYMVTHDLDSLARICDRIAALAEGRVIATGTMADMLRHPHPWLRKYFGGERARAAGVRA